MILNIPTHILYVSNPCGNLKDIYLRASFSCTYLFWLRISFSVHAALACFTPTKNPMCGLVRKPQCDKGLATGTVNPVVGQSAVPLVRHKKLQSVYRYVHRRLCTSTTLSYKCQILDFLLHFLIFTFSQRRYERVLV